MFFPVCSPGASDPNHGLKTDARSRQSSADSPPSFHLSCLFPLPPFPPASSSSSSSRSSLSTDRCYRGNHFSAPIRSGENSILRAHTHTHRDTPWFSLFFFFFFFFAGVIEALNPSVLFFCSSKQKQAEPDESLIHLR